jgi:HEAT repeat protein
MIDSRAALDAVVRHAVDLEDDYDEIAPTIQVLSACADGTLIPPLNKALDRFLDEKNFYGRDLIARILAGVQGAVALPTLLRASARDLGDDQDSLSAEIIDLMHAHPAPARRTAVEFATSDVPTLRRTGLWALGFVAQAEDLALLAAAAADADSMVRSTAIRSIPNLDGEDPAYHVVLSAVTDPDQQVRVAAVSRLGFAGRPDAVAPLAALADDPAAQVRTMVAYALGRLGGAETVPALLQLLRDSDQHVREGAVEALGFVGGPSAVDSLLTLASAEDPHLRGLAAGALTRAGDSDPRVPQLLVSLAHDEEASVRAATISGRPAIGDKASYRTSLMAGLAGDPDPGVRLRVAAHVRRLEPDIAEDVLRRYADDPDERVRRIAGIERERLNNSSAAN